MLDTWPRGHGSVGGDTHNWSPGPGTLTKLWPLLRKLQIIFLGWAGLGWAGVLVSQEVGRGGEEACKAKKGNGKPVNAWQMNKPAADIAPELSLRDSRTLVNALCFIHLQRSSDN